MGLDYLFFWIKNEVNLLSKCHDHNQDHDTVSYYCAALDNTIGQGHTYSELRICVPLVPLYFHILHGIFQAIWMWISAQLPYVVFLYITWCFPGLRSAPVFFPVRFMPPSFIPKELPPFNANTSIGAFEIGTLLATTLFGATCIQVYIYFERYAKDHKLIKALVCSLSPHPFSSREHNWYLCNRLFLCGMFRVNREE